MKISLNGIIQGVLKGYQRFISPFFPQACRFYPSCSEYARQCFERYGFLRGFYLTLRRLLRCHPYCKGGLDFVHDYTDSKC